MVDAGLIVFCAFMSRSGQNGSRRLPMRLLSNESRAAPSSRQGRGGDQHPARRRARNLLDTGARPDAAYRNITARR
jgi:hypothetical protein